MEEETHNSTHNIHQIPVIQINKITIPPLKNSHTYKLIELIEKINKLTITIGVIVRKSRQKISKKIKTQILIFSTKFTWNTTPTTIAITEFFRWTWNIDLNFLKLKRKRIMHGTQEIRKRIIAWKHWVEKNILYNV